MALAVGDVIRIGLVATITSIDATTITVRSFGNNDVPFPKAINNDPGFTYDVVPTPEPAYVTGEVYRDAEGNMYLRMGGFQVGDRWRVLLHRTKPLGSFVAENFPVRPLTRMVPEVTS